MTGPARVGQWVLLAYRMPRDPSTPRIAVWRKLDALGVARLGDGLVTLPADARTRELIDWVAQDVDEAGGSATVWLASPGSATQERAIAESMRAARAAEYQAVLAQARAATAGDAGRRSRLVRKLRGELRRIERRDFFPPAEHDQARAAVAALATNLAPAPSLAGQPCGAGENGAPA